MFRSLLVLVLNVIVLAGVCQACSCNTTEQHPCQQALRPGTVIFVGKVLKTIPPKLDPDAEYVIGPEEVIDLDNFERFTVEEALYENLGAEVTVCGLGPLSPGDRYLIIANRSENGRLWTNMCMGSRKLDATDDALLVVLDALHGLEIRLKNVEHQLSDLPEKR